MSVVLYTPKNILPATLIPTFVIWYICGVGGKSGGVNFHYCIYIFCTTLPQNICGRRTVYYCTGHLLDLSLQSQNSQRRPGDHIVLRNALKMCPIVDQI